VSSSGTSTTAARSPSSGAGTGRTAGAVVAIAVTAEAAAASCCDPAATSVSRGGSVAAASLLPTVALSMSAASWELMRLT
jgi:hypothetical protein